ncbi:MAG: DNA topoisomerase [Bacteroidales bacterium]|nr:DNA topoisomerase [Bacteroidales bacterium]
MGKKLFIAEKPSVAQEFAKALKDNFSRNNGFWEGNNYVVTWCVGHLVTMSYPEVYDANLKRWNINTLPFIPKEFLYEIIPAVERQFEIVKSQLNREDVDCIYVCTDSGREGEYIYRLVDKMANVPANKQRRRVWIDSQTEDEIKRGIQQAKPLDAYDFLSDAAYLRAQEDYLMGINFSRILTIKYGNTLKSYLKADKNIVVAVGRVMTCVLGMVVRREREIRKFIKTPYYRIIGKFSNSEGNIDGEWKAVENTKYFQSPKLFKENGFKKLEDAQECVDLLKSFGNEAVVESVEKKKEKKNPPLLFNLAELQNECSKLFKISPDETLAIVQELYEKKLVTYPRTDARVLSTAVAKEITKNLHGLATQPLYLNYCKDIKTFGTFNKIDKTRYTDDKQITDHYAIIPTGQGFGALSGCSDIAQGVYDRIVRRFLAIFYPPAEYKKVAVTIAVGSEKFFSNFKALENPGYLVVNGQDVSKIDKSDSKDAEGVENEGEQSMKMVTSLKKGTKLNVDNYEFKEGETTPPKRYNSGSLILAMENAGQFIEDEELRAQVKGSGIGTSATRAEILKKLVSIGYLFLNQKTQIITPARLGEMIYEIVKASIKQLLNAELTASWEKGLTLVADGNIKKEEYLTKLESFITKMTNSVKDLSNYMSLSMMFNLVDQCYKLNK